MRIVVIGTSGSGKTTLAKQLANRFNLPHVEFDALRHGPNWVETPDDTFRELLADALSGESWVADGNYSIAREVVWPRATTLLWLDYPFGLIIWRLLFRTLRRSILREELWWHFVTKDSLFLWAFQTHWRRRKTFLDAFIEPEHSHLKVLRMRSPGATKKWLKEVTAYQVQGSN